VKDRRIDLVSRHWIGGIRVKTIGDVLCHGILSESYTDYDGVFAAGYLMLFVACWTLFYKIDLV